MAQKNRYGVCTDGVVAVRGETADTSELVTQLLFGDAFKILKTSPDFAWVYIENHYDAYQGWIRRGPYKLVDKAYYQAYAKENHPVASNSLGKATLKREVAIESAAKTGSNATSVPEKTRTYVSIINIPIGSTLPFYKDGFIQIGKEKFAFKGEVKAIDQKSSKSELIQVARSYLGSPYLWGGKTSEGLDCSGFTQMVFKINGYPIPRDSYQQAEKGKVIPFEQAKAGDLVFFQRKPEGNGKVVHVGIVLEEGKIIHSDGQVRINKLDAKGIYRDDLGKYSHYLKFVKRIE